MRIWKNRKNILYGFLNLLFKTDRVEVAAKKRLKICMNCKLYDITGEGCYVKGTQPCCNQLLNGCGCSIAMKVRSLADSCPMSFWGPEV